MENAKVSYEEIIDSDDDMNLEAEKSNNSKLLSSSSSLGKHDESGQSIDDNSSVFNTINIKSLFIISTEFWTALSFYGFSSSVVLFFQTRLNYTNAAADIQFSYWNAACNIAPLIGGYLADSNIGRVTVILVFSCINLLGQSLAVSSAKPGVTSLSLSLVAIYILALGFGGVQPNLPTLGADQFDMNVEKDRVGRESFFAWFYWGINLGAFISYTLIAYICQYGIDGAGGIEWGFFTGYLVCACSQGIAVLVFLLGVLFRYREKPVLSGTVDNMMGIVWQASWRRLRLLISQAYSFSVWMFTRSQQTSLTPEERNRSELSVLDDAKRDFGGSYEGASVENAKLLMRLVPFLIAMIPYWGCYSQMNTAFQNQACQMDLHLGSVRIPVSALNVFDCLSILLFIPVFDRVIYPLLSKFGCQLTMLGKISKFSFKFTYL